MGERGPNIWITLCYFFQSIIRGTESGMEQPVLQPAFVCNTGVAGTNLNCDAMMPAPDNRIFNQMDCWFFLVVTGIANARCLWLALKNNAEKFYRISSNKC